MRAIALLLTAATAVSFQNYVTFGGDGADVVFRQSRNAVGGEAAVTGVTSLVMKGAIQVSTADGGPAERAVEVRMLLPDQYVRIETGKDWTKRSGFSGSTLLTRITKAGAVDTPPANVAPALLRAEKWRFARMLLGIASMATPEVWLNVRQAPGTGQSGTPTGARVLEAASRDNFLVRVFYDAASLPERVDYEANRRRISTSFTDRRKVGQLLLPHTIRTTLDGMPLEEMKFTEIVVNPRLTVTDFEKMGSDPN